MGRQEVRFVSATPSYWRRLITLVPARELRTLRLEQITLGGELSDQPLLDRLKGPLPGGPARSYLRDSELGRCFSVKDGRAGFPAASSPGTRGRRAS